MELKHFFAKWTAIFINGPAILLNNDPTNPPDWIILDIWALESFKSVDILLLLKACLAVSNNLCGKSFPLYIFELVVPVLFLTASFSFYIWVFDNLTFSLVYSAIYINYRTFVVLFENSNIVSFDFSRR